MEVNAKSQRISGLDFLKAFAICGVIAIHVPLFKVDFINNPTAGSFLQYALRLLIEGVPIFMAINGFLLFKKRNFNIKQHFKKTFRLFLIFLIWGVIITVICTSLDNPSQKLSIPFIIKSILYVKPGGAPPSVLWFIQELIAVYLIFPIFKKVYDTDFQIFKYVFLVFFILFITSNIIILSRDFAATFSNTNIFSDLLFSIKRFNIIDTKWCLFYFLLGGMIYHYIDIIKNKRTILLIIGLTAWLFSFFFGLATSELQRTVYNQTFNFSSLFFPFILVAMFALVLPMKNDNKIKNIISKIGQNTMGIYLTHMIFISIFYYIIPTERFIERLLFCIITLFASFILTICTQKQMLLKIMSIK